MPLSEFSLIDQFFKQPAAYLTKDSQLLLGIGDDAAVIKISPEENLVVSTDSLVAGVHFLPDADPKWLAYKSLAVNLSDMAAMGAQPRWFLLSLTLPELNEVWLKEFSAGLFQLAQKESLQLIGGNIARGPLNINIQIMGTVKGKGLTRSGAKIGDDIWVTGELGAGYQPHASRIDAGLALRKVAHAAIDLSDGLLGDLAHICQASGVGADIFLEKLPLHPAVKNHPEVFKLALTAGEDYELCFTAAKDQRDHIELIAKQLSVPMSCIGHVCADLNVNYYLDQKILDVSSWHGFEHFSAH